MNHALIPQQNPQALAIRRRARGLNIDKMSDSDAVDAFVGVVNSLIFKDSDDRMNSNGERVTVRWSSPENKTAAADPKKNTIELPWPGPAVDAEKYLALRGYTLQEFGRMKLTHPDLLPRVSKNGGEDAAAVAGIIESRRVDRVLQAGFGSTYTDARAQIVSDCRPTPEQQAEFDAADPVTKLHNDFAILARGLGYNTSSPGHIVDRLKKWMTLAGQEATKKGLTAATWGFSEDTNQLFTRTNQQAQSNAAQLSANLTEIFLKSFKDVYDSRPPKDPNQDQQQQGDGQGQGQGQGGGGGAGNSPPGPPSMQDQMQQGMQSTADPGQYHQCVQQPTDAQEEVAAQEGHGTSGSEHLGSYRRSNTPDLVEILRRRGARVASTLRRALAAKSRFGDETDMDDGDLDPEKLCEIARGKWDAPFMRPGRIIHDRDTAVHICLDGSSSMASPPSEGGGYSSFMSAVNRRSCTSAAEAIEAVCAQMTPDAASAFRDLASAMQKHGGWANNASPNAWVSALMASQIWVAGATLAIHDALRSSRISHEVSVFAGPYIVLKNWKQRSFPPNIMNAFRDGGFASGGTPAGTSWKNSLGSLLKRPETRRILIVMSDGEIPSDEAKIGSAVIQTARELGIECYGLGIRSNGVARVFPKGSKSVATVNFADDLNRRMQDLVHGILTKQGDAR